MRICHVVPSLEERHGGPSRSVRALANTQAAANPSIRLLSTWDPRQARPETGPDQARISLHPREWPQRLCRSRRLRRQLLAEPVDCLHHHALWLLPLRYAREAARQHDCPLVISPRGMFSGWALEHHRWRKRLAELLVHPGAFAAAAGWHATSAEEAAAIRRLGFTQPVCVAPNGVELPEESALHARRQSWLNTFPELARRRVALFYSRFHDKKRVRELMAVWGSRPRGDWMLLVAGLPEQYQAAALAAEAAALPHGDSIRVVDSTGLPQPFAAAELFLLPSHSENFGLVIAEALAAGVPALVTDTTPWRELDRVDAGRCVAWPGFAPALDALLAASPAELASLGRNARQWAAREFTWERAARLTLDFYRHLARG